MENEVATAVPRSPTAQQADADGRIRLIAESCAGLEEQQTGECASSALKKRSAIHITFFEDPFEVELFLAHVLDLLRARGFALNCNGAGVTDPMKPGEYVTEIHQALADENLAAEFAGIGGPATVFGMNAANVRAKDSDGVNWVSLPVEDQIGSVEADGEVRHGHVTDDARHRSRGLLPGFHQEILPIVPAMLSDFVNGVHSAGIKMVGRIFGDEAAVCLDLGDIQQFGKVGDLAKGIDAGGARGGRNEADGGGAAGKIPLKRFRANHLNSGCGDVVFCQQFAELACEFRCEGAEISIQRKEAVGKSEFMHPADAFLRSSEWTDQ